MIRVILSQSLLDYREEIAELAREASAKPAITGVAPRRRDKESLPGRKDPRAFRLDGLLQPPRVELLDPYLFEAEGQADSIIRITASGRMAS